MYLNAWHIILFIIIGWAATLSGVALGGFLVFRTKRDQFDRLFSNGGTPKGDAFVLDDGGTDPTDIMPAEIPEKISGMNKRFVDIFADRMAERGAE